MCDELEKAIRFRRQDAALHCDLAILADAYVAHLDEQEALNVPYDWEWLESRPEFKSKSYGLMAAFKSSGIFVFVYKDTGEWVIANRITGQMSIPAPATKAAVIKLLEVFS